MPAPTTVPEFLTIIEQSKLLSPEQGTETKKLATSHDDPRMLAKALVDRGWITHWQARQMLAGGTSFFLGRYKLLERVGAGARGKVYRAEQAPINRVVALKILDLNLLDDPEVVARWQREIRMAAALNHPSIVTAYDSEHVGDIHFMVMEYVAGRDLKAFVDDFGPLPIDFSCECIRQAAAGMHHAHERGIIHRDIKAGNLLVVADNPQSYPLVKVLDLGFARFITDEQNMARITQPWQTFGTPEYMAPEQAESAQKADLRADIFSLGVTLFKLLTASFPYDGITKMQKMLARANNEAKRIRTVRPDIPQALDDIIAKMLARSPDNRFQSAQEVVKALQPFCMPSPRRN